MPEVTLAGALVSQADCADISAVAPENRLLLLPHCLRPSQDCPGKMTPNGLSCGDCRRPDCAIARLTVAARAAGYGNTCIAPGGKLAVRCVKATRPQAIIAVACDKELEEGAAAVHSLDWLGRTPVLVQVPLTRDGCVDTEVDVDLAIQVIQS